MTRIDWIAAQLSGEVRDLSWYIARAENGDRDAALRALDLCSKSLTPQGLKDAGAWLPDHLVQALLCIIGPAGVGDSAVMQAARGKPRRRGLDVNGYAIGWWLCCDMHRLLQASIDPADAEKRPTLTKIEAANIVLEGKGKNGGEPESLVKRYSTLEKEIAAFCAEQDAAAFKASASVPEKK